MSFFSRPAKSILHPTDFSATSESAFAHALAIAVRNEAELTILHVVDDSQEDVPWHDYPAVRSTLQRWGYLEEGASRKDIESKLGVEIKKAVGVEKDVATAIVRMVDTHDFDLIVMGTKENREHPFYVHNHIAVPVSQKAHLPTLFVPQDVPGCVEVEDGKTNLNQVLLPITHEPDAQPIIDRMSWALKNFGGPESNVTLLHVGSNDKFPSVQLPQDEGINWTKLNKSGTTANAIVSTAKETEANVIAMVTEGKKGFWDAIQGSTVQQVLRKAPCPIFTIPASDWY